MDLFVGKLTRESKKDLNVAFQKWAGKQLPHNSCPQFAVIASVGVSSGVVRARFLTNEQYKKLDDFIQKEVI